MALSKVTSEVLNQLSQTLDNHREDINHVQEDMNTRLESFIWDDPVGLAYKAKYYEDLKPIQEKLIPNLISYCSYLQQQAAVIDEFGVI